MNNPFRKRRLTRNRILLAAGIAVAADGIQLALGPLGWALADQIVDVLAMVLVSLVLGFHPLFLPTFVAELFPGIGMLPTWTGCVALATVQRWKQQSKTPPALPPGRDAMDV